MDTIGCSSYKDGVESYLKLEKEAVRQFELPFPLITKVIHGTSEFELIMDQVIQI
jgi:hypothetical protein